MASAQAAAPRIRSRDVADLMRAQAHHTVPVAEYNVYLGPVEGSVINFAPAGRRAADRIWPRAAPPRILPRPVSGFLDRDQEQNEAGTALARRQIVDLHGPDGTGKTALLSQAMQTLPLSSFPDGLVYISARNETYTDLLQSLFNCFFEADDGVKVTENDVRMQMAGKRALIVVDDANHLKEGEAEALAQVVPQCALLIAGREQQVSSGVGIFMRGLPRAEAVALFERSWGPVSPGDRPAVEAICAALEHVPLAIIKTASTASQRHQSLQQVLQQVQPRTEPPDPVGQAFWSIGSNLSEGERRVLAGLAAAGGSTVGVEALSTITGLAPDQVDRYLNRLQNVGLVHTNSPRYGLDEGFRAHVWYAWVSEGMQTRAADYYLRRAGSLRGPAKDPDEENVLAALRYYFHKQMWGQVVDIVRAAEPYLATAGRWGQWRRRLNQAWHAAQQSGQQPAEAWAQNQLGIIAMVGGDRAAAEKLFRGALRIWRTLGDQTGMTIAGWNLQMLLGLPGAPPGKSKPPTQSGWPPAALPLALGAVATLLLVILGGLIGIALNQPTPTPTFTLPPPVATTLTPSHTPRTPTDTPTPSRTPTPVTEEPPCACGDETCNRESPCKEDGYNCVADCCICGDGICEAEYPCSEGEGDCPDDCTPMPPPAPTPLSPVDGEGYSCPDPPVAIAFEWGQVGDESGIASYTVQVERVSALSGTGTQPPPGLVEEDVVDEPTVEFSLDCGWNYRWRVRATDGAGYSGGWSFWEPFYVETYDDQGPSIGYVYLTPGGNACHFDPITVETTITDPSGVDRAELEYTFFPDSPGLAESGSVLMSRSVNTYSATLSSFDPGELHLWVRAWDERGNESVTSKSTKDIEDCIE